MKEKRTIRQDGHKTKITILQWAGRLIAEKGFDSVTSKEICEKAGVNQAAVKYHFGSREDLYFSLLKYVHNRLISMEKLQEIHESPLSGDEKMEQIVNFLTENVFHKKDWEMTVWIRELMNPSETVRKIIKEAGLPKISLAVKIFSEYTGYGEDDPRLYSAMLATVAPFNLVLLASHNGLEKEIPLPVQKGDIEKTLKKTILQNLKTMKKK